MRAINKTFFLVASVLALGNANAATIDFDATPVDTYSSLSSLTFGGATLTYLGGNGNFQIRLASPGSPISGNAAISYFDNPGSSPFKLSFSSPVSYVQVGVGDYNDDVDNTFMQAFDSLDQLIGSTSFVNSADTYGGGFLTIAVANISYVKFWDDEPFPGAVYWDSITYENRGTVPEPASLALLGLGLAGLASMRKIKTT